MIKTRGPAAKKKKGRTKNSFLKPRKKSSTDFFELFFQHIPHGCLLLDREKKVHAANQTALGLLGKEFVELSGQTVDQLLTTALPVDWHQAWRKNEPQSWEMPLKQRTVLCSLHPLPSGSPGRPEMAALFLADITEHKKAQEIIKQELERQRFLLSLASSLLSSPFEKIDSLIQQSLEKIGQSVEADRASLICEKGGGQYGTLVAEWRTRDRPTLQKKLQKITPLSFLNWYESLRQKEVVRVSSPEDVPSDSLERKFMTENGIKSILLVPLIQEQRTIGCLGISSSREITWEEETINFLSLAAEIFSSAIKRRQRGQTMATLLHIGEAAAIARNLESLLRIIHESISELMPANNFYLALYDREKELVYFPYFVDEKDETPVPRSLRRGITEYVLRTGQPLLAKKEDIEGLISRGEIELFGTIPHVWLGVPLKIDGQTIGVMALQSYDQNITYTPDDEALLRLISEDVALAIYRKKSEEELAEKEQFLRHVFMSIQDGLSIIDRDYRLLTVNQSIERKYARVRPLEGQKCYEALYGRSEPCPPCPGRQTIETGLPSMEVIPFAYPESQSQGWLEVFTFPLRDKNTGQITGVIEYIRDITARKQAEDKLKESLNEKETLLRELHHRVKNNMQVISSLLNLQANHVTDPVAKEMFHESQRRIRSMALVHEKLYQSANLCRIDFGEYLKHLSTHLFQSCGVSTHRVHLHLELEELPLEVNTAIPLGMIFNEIMTNALKHAFPGERKGEIRVILQRFRPGRASLEIKDNGIGLPPGFSLENSETLGLQIIKTLSHQIRADVIIEVEHGTSYKIIFSYPESS